MSYSPGIGLILNLGVDASGVDQGLDDANKKLGDLAGKTGKQFADAGEKTDKALLSNRESVRLLTEEMGIHLPRAVTGALGEMLPEIGSLSTALLGVFAVKEAVEFVGYIHKIRDELTGVVEAEKALKKAVDENDKAMEAMAKKSLQYAQDQLRELNVQIVAQELANEQLYGKMEKHQEYLGGLYAYLFDKWTGNVEKLKGGEASLNAEYNRRVTLLNVIKQDLLDANKELAKSGKESADQTERNTLTERRWHEEVIKGGQEAGKVAAEIAKHNLEVAASAVKAAQDELKFTLELEKLGIVEQKDLNFLKQYTPAAKAAETQTVKLGEARKALAGITQDATRVEEAFKQAVAGDSSALDSMMESAGQTAEAIASMTESTKAVAYVEGSYDAAKAIECMAKFIGSYGTDGAQLAASVQWAAAAEQQFAVAGRGSHHTATGGSAGREGGQPGPQAPGAMGTVTPITPGVTSVGSGGGGGGGGSNITVHVYGPHQEAAHIASVLNNYTTRLGGQLVSSRSIAPPKAGR